MGNETSDTVIRSFSESAPSYDSAGNLKSCWGKAASHALRRIRLKPRYRMVADVGCGTGRALRALARRTSPSVRFIGVEPAEQMRVLAASRVKDLGHVEIVDGRFEALPFEDGTVDYLLSILVFHWTSSPERSVAELARVLGPAGEMDLFFAGRDTGREFTARTTPIFLRHLGRKALMESMDLRRKFTAATTEALFLRAFPAGRLAVHESRTTYYDDIDGHWSWWVPRTAGQMRIVPPERREDCDAEIRRAVAGLGTSRGIPYTIHLLHVRVGR